MTESTRPTGPTAGWLEVPQWIHHYDEAAHRQAEQRSSEQAEWGYGIPAVFRWVNGGDRTEPLPRPPHTAEANTAAVAYWTALLHVLLYSLGWTQPAAGLRWWHNAGRPRTDTRLDLIGRYHDDGMLDWFAAWLDSGPLHEHLELLATIAGAATVEQPLRGDETWIEEQRRRADESGVPAPISWGGTDPLHLAMHCNGPLGPLTQEPLLLRSGRDARRAVLVLDAMPGWHRALIEQGSTLPDIGERSWRVDVVVRPTGFLGTYRRSRETGRWFAGPHRHHQVGAQS